MKKYNTSLKILFEEEMLNEGFSRLGAPRTTSDRPDVCRLDVPSTLIQYLLVSKDSGTKEVISILETIKTEGVKGAPGAVFGAFGEFLENFASGIVNNPQYLQDAQELLSLTTLTGIPAVYCKFFNLFLKKIDRILSASGLYNPDPIDNNNKNEEVNQDFSIFKELSASGKNLLEKRLRISLDAYDQLPIVKNNFFISRNIDFKYGYAYFENFLKKHISSNEFDADLLEEDRLVIESIIKNIKDISEDGGISAAYEDASVADVLDYDELSFYDDQLETYETFDKENVNDAAAGKVAKSIILKEYTSFLLVVIRKMFYDKDIKSMIGSNEFLKKLADIERLLTNNGGNEKYFATN